MADDFLALSLDDEVVLLHPDRARMVVLDAWAKQVWEHCDGRTTEELVRVLSAPLPRVRETLHTLTGTGVISCAGDRWVRLQTRWV